tara:strand:+ start:303 stop:572 length:270 start_codon:yes stop_codon:yes gene_type:complete
MAPKRKPLSQLRRSAKNYRLNPKSRLKKNAAQRTRNKTTENKKYRAELNRARRKAGAYGKGGKDFSHTKSGRIVRENPSTNRARNRGKK